MAHSTLEDVSASRFTDATIRRMYELVDRAKTDAAFQKLVYGIVNHSMHGQWKQYRREVETIFTWAKRTIDYRRDPYGVELLQDVWATLDRKRADCDDFSILLASAFEILGAPTRFVTVSTRPNGDPSHVYAVVLIDGQWLGADAIVHHSHIGWEPPNVTNRKVWTRNSLGLSGDDDLAEVDGLGKLGGPDMNNRYPWYRSEGSVPTYMQMGGLRGTSDELDGYSGWGADYNNEGLGDLASIFQTVTNIASGIISGVKTGTVTNVGTAIDQAALSYAQAREAQLQAQLATAATVAERARLQAEDDARRRADAAALQAQAGAMPGWVLPLAGGAAVLGLAAYFARGRR